ncbi:MAG: hypothetical protein J2P37_22545 [Ktedonobacteraceae bacterium]|nr:hypothetical protein [Ktedonobacteraceae bacterium]
MTTTVTQKPAGVEYPLAIECATLSRLLLLCHPQATILMTRLERVLPTPSGAWRRQWAVHLTARRTERASPILFSTVLVAQAEGIGLFGRLVFPERTFQDDPQIHQRGEDLAQQCYDLLLEVLPAHPGHLVVQRDARYRLPDEWVWSVRSSLEGINIAFQQGSWTRSSITPSSPEEAQHG